MPNKSYEIIIGKKIKVTEDKKTKAKIISLPFEFPDQTRGMIIVLKLKNEAWIPSLDIKSLNINFT